MRADFPSVAWLSLLACIAAGAAVREQMVRAEHIQGGTCTLQCAAKSKPGVQYHAVRWYKVSQGKSPSLHGLLTKNLPNGTTRWYVGVEREVELLEETHDIVLRNLTCSDVGVYRCYLAAPVGEQNRDGDTRLTLADCPADTMENPLTEKAVSDTILIIFASVMLLLAFIISLISYACLKSAPKEKSKEKPKQIFVNAPLKPLEEKDLMLIKTLGPKLCTMKHVYV
ncbi:CD83 antigen [Pholidichthys leucotaenia]